MDNDKILHSWTDFSGNVSNPFREPLTNQDFTDVTLTTEDDHLEKVNYHDDIKRKYNFMPAKNVQNIKYRTLCSSTLDIPHKTLPRKVYNQRKEYKIKNYVRFYCTTCPKIFSTAYMSLLHKQSKHEDIRYRCNQCSFKAKYKSNLKQHQQSQHEIAIYSCDQCGYKATLQSNLRTHQQSKHKGVRYSCDQCEFKSTQ